MKDTTALRLVRVSCYLTLLGLALFVWSVLDPRPIPVMFAMSIGQGFGTLAAVLFVVVILRDLRRSSVLGDRDR